jgi:hypothetical protein
MSDANAVNLQDWYVDASVFNFDTPPKNIYSLKLSWHWWEVPWQENDHKDEVHDLLDPNSTSKIVGTITLGYTAEVLYLLCKFNHLQVSASHHAHFYLGLVIELYSNKCKSGFFLPRFGPWFLCTGYLFSNLPHFVLSWKCLPTWFCCRLEWKLRCTLLVDSFRLWYDYPFLLHPIVTIKYPTYISSPVPLSQGSLVT